MFKRNSEKLIEIFEDTKDLIQFDYSKNVSNSITSSVIYKGHDCNKLELITEVTAETSFQAAIRLRKEFPDKKIAVLNFASATNPGGGVTRGTSAQEECLCRASTLYPVIADTKFFKDFYLKNRNQKNPLHDDDILYAKDILILKDDSNDYKELNNPVKIDIITCAAPNLREHTTNQYNPADGEHVSVSDKELFNLHLNRALNIMEAAFKNDVKILVLGAFGCGVFKNDPNIVAAAYKRALLQYMTKFDRITFAIYSKGDTTNFDTFERILRDICF